MRCADANKSARGETWLKTKRIPGLADTLPCIRRTDRQTDREIDSLAANDSWLLSPSASEIRTAEPLCCCCFSPNGLEVSPHLARERESLMHAGIYIIPPSQLKTLDSRQVPRTKTLTQIRLALESATALGASKAKLRPRPKPNINYNHATRGQDSDNRTTSKLIEINANAQSRQKERGRAS